MASSLNRVTILGNLGRDPELRYTATGKPVATLSIATSSRRKNKSGQWEDETQWHRVTVLGEQAEWAGEKLTKGRTVYVEGALRYGSYDKQGVRIPTIEIVASHIEPFGPKKTNQDAGQGGQSNSPAPDQGDGSGKSDDDWIRDYDQA